MWENYPLLTWCKGNNDKQSIAKAFFTEAFANKNYGALDFLQMVFKTFGLLVVDDIGMETRFVEVEEGDVDFNVVSWAFAFYKRLKAQGDAELVRRFWTAIKGMGSDQMKELYTQALLHLIKIWR